MAIITGNIRPVSEDKGHSELVRGQPTRIEFVQEKIVVDLSRPGGRPDDSNAARIHIELTNYGWVVFLHNDDSGVAAEVVFHNDKTLTIGKE